MRRIIGAVVVLAAVVTGWVAYPAAHASASGIQRRPLTWIVNQRAVSLLRGAGLTQRQAQQLFGNRGTFLVTSAGGSSGVSGATRTATFTSYAALRATLTGKGLPPGTGAVLYDNEHWSLTPPAEQRNPAKYEALAAALVHARHLLFVSTPGTTLTDMLAPGNSDHYAAYLALGLASSAARYANVIDIQAQGSETDLARYVAFVRAAAAQAHRANPRVAVLAGISTNPSGQRVTSTQFAAAVFAVRPFVVGFWLNIPAAGTACPRCGTPQPQVAMPLLRSLFRF